MIIRDFDIEENILLRETSQIPNVPIRLIIYYILASHWKCSVQNIRPYRNAEKGKSIILESDHIIVRTEIRIKLTTRKKNPLKSLNSE